MKFKLHNQETAPEASKPLLADSLQAFSMIPNLHAVMAESPAVLESYQVMHELFQKTSFNADELTVVWQTINVEHECHYCVPAHTGIANMMKVDANITDALRNGTELPSKKLQALHETTLELVRERGNLREDTLSSFSEAGYEQRHLLKIILGLSQKVMSNYINRLSNTPIDTAFKEFSWQR
ncbi:carboxymuconolactone decarboxylase [Gammaproteobacteria bacterium 42_54_T18]|nr:carboxymuconolactone decarboxylase [Gammaproteobacteria bacterium 42_54_T18]